MTGESICCPSCFHSQLYWQTWALVFSSLVLSGDLLPFELSLWPIVSLTVSVLVFAMALVSALSEPLRRFNALILLEVESNYPCLQQESAPERAVSRRSKHCHSQHLTAAGCGSWWVGGCLQRCRAYCLLWTRVLGAAGCPGLCEWAQPSWFCLAERAEDALGQNNCHGNIQCVLFHRGWCW